jgi:CheY-like chemotaxis protein
MTYVILVVDDDETVRSVVRVVLEREGYSVLEARDGAQALMMCDEFGSSPDLIVTDIKMPRVDGGELVRELSRDGKTPRVLLMSGFADEQVRNAVAHISTPFLQKPFTIEELARKVHEMLDNA